jgi:hypothetical protein
MSVALVVWFVTCISAYLTLVEFLTLLSFHVELWGRSSLCHKQNINIQFVVTALYSGT